MCRNSQLQPGIPNSVDLTDTYSLDPDNETYNNYVNVLLLPESAIRLSLLHGSFRLSHQQYSAAVCQKAVPRMAPENDKRHR
jgi:hypothetical protein